MSVAHYPNASVTYVPTVTEAIGGKPCQPQRGSVEEGGPVGTGTFGP